MDDYFKINTSCRHKIQKMINILPSLSTLLFIFLIFLEVQVNAQVVQFQDRTRQAGLPLSQYRNHYGGASVADLDGDGYVDLILGAHTLYSLVYFNNRDGTFSSNGFSVKADAHGFNAFHMSPAHPQMSFFMSRGGRKASTPTYPVLFNVNWQRKIKKADNGKNGFETYGRGRGRSILAVNLQSRNRKVPDFLFLNAAFLKYTRSPHRAFRLDAKTGKFSYVPEFNRFSYDFASSNDNYATVTDMNNDMQMEVLTMHSFRIYKVNQGLDYDLFDITKFVIPKKLRYIRGVRAIVELDYNNDGFMDLYISRATTNDLKWMSGYLRKPYDILLRNVGGKFYAEETSKVKLPYISTQGATAGDFNNDGLIDLFVTRYNEPDILLLNRFDSKSRKHYFQQVYDYGKYKRPKFIPGDQPVAVDYDRDGKLDLVVAEGDWYNEQKRGIFKLIRNISPMGYNTFLLVRVKSAPFRRATSLHALVKVCIGKGRGCMIRRVGSPGVAVSSSYIEVVHFGLGRNIRTVRSVSVRWVDGQIRMIRKVGVNRVITFGTY